jgi:hypothetical protein
MKKLLGMIALASAFAISAVYAQTGQQGPSGTIGEKEAYNPSQAGKAGPGTGKPAAPAGPTGTSGAIGEKEAYQSSPDKTAGSNPNAPRGDAPKGSNLSSEKRQ